MLHLRVIMLGFIMLVMVSSANANPSKHHKSLAISHAQQIWHSPKRLSPGEASAVLIQAASSGNLAIAKYCITHGTNLNATNKLGFTPLMEAATGNQLGMIKLLISAGASVNFTTPTGMTAIFCADKSTANLLRRYGAKGQTDNEHEALLKPWKEMDAHLRVDYDDLTADEDGTGTASVKGNLVNQSGHPYSYVEIDINFYDANGNQVDSSQSNIQDLASDGHWDFVVHSFAKNIDHHKIIHVFGH